VIYLVRHGQTEFNLARRFQGALDSPLTALGIEQARAYGRRLRDLLPPDAPMVSSPLGRALRTAQIIREEAGFTANIALDSRLAEITVGEWDGRTDEEIERAYPGARGGHGNWDWHFHAPGGETYEAFAGRLGSWLEDAAKADQPFVAVSHGGCSRILRGLYASLPKGEFLRLPVPQDAVFLMRGGAVERLDCEPAIG